MDQNETTMGGGRGAFDTTRWTCLHERDHAEILRLYWRPVYLHLRRRGFTIEDAKDLTQGFFEKFMERDFAAQADRSRGRFRDFLRFKKEQDPDERFQSDWYRHYRDLFGA